MITLWNRNDHLGHDGLEAGVACFRHQLAQMDEVHALAERCCLEEIERLKVPHELHVRHDERAGLEPAPENEIEVRNPGSQPPHVSRRRLG